MTASPPEAGAAIGFRRLFPTDPLLNPLAEEPGLGWSSVTWITAATGDTAVASLDTSKPAEAPPPRVAPGDSLWPGETGAGLESTSTGASSTGSTGLLPFPTGEKREPEAAAPPKPAKPVYHPTILSLLDLPLVKRVDLDTSTGLIRVTSHLSGVELSWGAEWDSDTYLARSAALSDRMSWRRSVLKKQPTVKGGKGTGIEISIPVFKSRQARRIFGGSDVGLSVTGNISVDGSFKVEKRENQSLENPQPTNYQFKVDQSQQFVIKGKVGEKVSVEIDQDSERMFDFENNLRVSYKGAEDEILQSVEAGNVSLSLGGASLVSVSAKHEGLFGFKTVSQVGGLSLTTIASLKKGQTQEIKLEGGAQTGRPITIHPNEYVPNRYYFLDNIYREYSRYRSPELLRIAVPPEVQILDAKVYKSVGINDADATNAVRGWALYNPTDTVGLAGRDPDQEHQNGLFLQLIPGSDYLLQNDLGYIRFNKPLERNTIIAVAYRTRLGEFGDMDESDNRGEGAPPLILKLLQPRNPLPTDSTWNLMWRNVYDLRATNITREGFEGKITRPEGSLDASAPDVAQDGTPYIRLFGLDFGGVGSSLPDGQIDEVFLDFALGELIFPDLQPFAPVGWFRGSVEVKTNLGDSTLFTPGLYTTQPSLLDQQNSPFQLEFRFKSVSAVYSLGFNVLPGSVEVFMNGQKLTQGVDYTMDYLSGDLTLLRTEALSPTASIEIKYETGELFQTDTETMLGVRAEYALGDNSSVGTTLAYYNEKKLDRRVRVGGEPTRNMVWDINARLQFKPQFLTDAVDWLPLVETDKPSTVTLDAEFARVHPQPNSLNSPSTGDYNGVAYIDDFESVKRITPLGITMVLWRPASFPVYDSRGQGLWGKQRGRLNWYNPLNQVRITDIWPDREVEAQASTMSVLQIDFQPWWAEWGASPPPGLSPELSWGGIMRYLGTGYADQTQAKYLEIWMRHHGRGVVYVDLGRLSEDALPDRRLNTEDTRTAVFPFGDGILTEAEDVGLDGVRGPDPTDSSDVNGDGVRLPSYDDWHPYTRSDYRWVNGTEGNRTFETGRYPDTEDLDNDGSLDLANDFFRYRIDLSEGDDNRYIVGGLGNPKGWRLYRIPLTDTLKVGDPDFAAIEYARIWLTGFRQSDWLQVAQIDIVGNEWLEAKARGSRGEWIEPVNIAVINTHDNRSEYTPPPGVSGERDPVTNLLTKEQSLVLRINRLPTGEIGQVYKQLPQRQPMNFLEYRRLKMFVHGGGPSGRLQDRFGRDLDLEFFLRFGVGLEDTVTSRQRYYEYSRRLQPGWLGNEVVIDLERLAALKFRATQDSSRNYDILPDGGIIRVVGEASLSDIRSLAMGVKNHGAEILPADRVEVWCDELRLSDIHKEPGWAAKGALNLNLADNFISLGADLQYNQADFHRIESRTGTLRDNLSGAFNSAVKLEQFFSPSWSLRFPLTFNYRQSLEVPRYTQAGDVKLTSLTGARVDAWDKFLDDLVSNRRYRGAPAYQNGVESQITSKKSFGYTASLGRVKRSSNPLIAYTLDGLRLNRLSLGESFGSSPTRLSEYSRVVSGDLSYDLTPQQPWELNWLSWTKAIPVLNRVADSRLRPLPSSLRLSAGGTENINRDTSRPTKTRQASTTERHTFNLSRTMAVGWRPLDILNADLSMGKTANRVPDDSMRTAYASLLVTLDSADYVKDGRFDQESWDRDFQRKLEQVKHDIYTKWFGNYFVDNEFEQTLNTGFRPSLVNWLGTDFGYNSRYTWRWDLGAVSAGSRSVGANGNFTSTVTFRLPAVLQNLGWSRSPVRRRAVGAAGEEEMPPWMMPGPELSPSPSQPPKPGEESGAPPPVMPAETDTLKTKQPKPPSPADLIVPLRAFLTRIRDIQWQFSRSDDRRNYSVGVGQASWGYRLGLTGDHGLGTVPGYRNSDTFFRRWNHRFSSGLDITDNLSVSSLQYEYGQSHNIAQEESGTITKTVYQIFGKDKVSIRALPAVNWDVRWGGWEKMPPFNTLAQSVSLEHSFHGSQTESWRRSAADVNRVVQTVEYERSFSPLLGINVTWKGGVGTSLRYNLPQRVTDSRLGNQTKSLDQSRDVSLTASYNARTGFRIPIPIWPFNNKRLSNSTTFSLTYSNRKSVQKNSDGGNPFEERDRTSSWSFRPSLEYAFSTNVRGGVHYEYAVQDSRRVGKTRSHDFGFSVNISIRG